MLTDHTLMLCSFATMQINMHLDTNLMFKESFIRLSSRFPFPLRGFVSTDLLILQTRQTDSRFGKTEPNPVHRFGNDFRKTVGLSNQADFLIYTKKSIFACNEVRTRKLTLWNLSLKHQASSSTHNI